MNMSYCRFQNTARDLDDCVDVCEEMRDGGTAKLSSEELNALKDLASRALDLVMLLADVEQCELDELDNHTERDKRGRCQTRLHKACNLLQDNASNDD